MGQARIHCVLKGIPLPPIGSFKFNVITEGLQREKQEKVAFARFMAALLGPASGLKAGEIGALVAAYAEEVHQFRYNYKYVPVQELAQRKAVAAANEDLRLMEKVAKFTVKD